LTIFENMANYKRLLIRQGAATNTVIDTLEQFHVACQEFPYKHLSEVKELAKNDWFDEDGEDVYIPSSGLKFKAYDLEAKLLYVGNEGSMTDDLRSFIDFLYGRNTNGNPELSIYDEFTKTGRQKVYVQSVDNELITYDDVNTDVIAQFKVKFRVTDPVTNVVLYLDDSSN